jgi:hypothetical protein
MVLISLFQLIYIFTPRTTLVLPSLHPPDAGKLNPQSGDNGGIAEGLTKILLETKQEVLDLLQQYMLEDAARSAKQRGPCDRMGARDLLAHCDER